MGLFSSIGKILGLSGGGYKETSADKDAAAALAASGALGQRVWEDVGRPDAMGALKAKQNVRSFNNSIYGFLGGQPGGTGATGTPATGGTGATGGTAPAAGPKVVSWDQAKPLFNAMKVGGKTIPYSNADHSSWDSIGNIIRSINNDQWWRAYGEDFKRQVNADPVMKGYLAQNMPQETLTKIGLTKETPDFFAQAGGGTPVADRNLDLSKFGFGQQIATPALQQTPIDLASTPGGISPDDYKTLSFLSLLPKDTDWTAAPDAATVGQKYADTLNAANLTRLDQQKRAKTGAAAAAQAMRGAGGGGTMGNATDRAVDLWAGRESARMNADTIGKQMELEALLRNEANTLLERKAGLGQNVLGAENQRVLSDAGLANTVAQQNRDDWYRKAELQRSIDADANQNAWGRVGWQAQERDNAKGDVMSLLNYLQADAIGQLNPYNAVNASSNYANQMAGHAGQIGSRQQQWSSNALANAGLIGNLFGAALGSPWLGKLF